MIPAEFLSRLKDILSAENVQRVEEAMHGPKATSFRVNTLLSSMDEVRALLQSADIAFTPVHWYPDAGWVAHDVREPLLASPAYADQKIYVQNQSSMIPPLVLDPQPGERVLDLAAAPGSKTLQITCLMEQDGEIAAVDAVKKRFYKLRDNLASQGADQVRTFLKDGRAVWKNRPEYFDRVLLDAPCSSEGRFHMSDPESFAYWSPRKIKEMAHKQKRLLYSAIQAVRPGGTVVYSTCSFAPEENEMIVDAQLRRFGDAVEVVPLGVETDEMILPHTQWASRSFDDQLAHARRILPGYHTDGFFVCKLVKRDSTLGDSQVKQ